MKSKEHFHDWTKMSIGQLFHVQLGKMLNKSAKLIEEQSFYLTNSNVRWGSFDLKSLNSMHFSREEKQKFSLQKGDLLVCEGGEIGRCAIWQEQLEDCYYQKALHRLRPREENIVLNEFCRAYLEFIVTGNEFKGLIGKSSIAHLTREKLVSLQISVPPLPEQKKIVQILSTWDEAIETVEKLIENAQLQKRALMHVLFASSVSLKIMTSAKLGDIALITMGNSPKSENYNQDKRGLPLIQGNADLYERTSKPRAYTSEVTKKCMPGNILMSVRAPVGNVAMSEHEACIGRGICAISAKSEIDQNYLFYWLMWFEPAWASISQGSTFDSINSSELNQVSIRYPVNRDQQRKISEILKNLDLQIKNFKNQLYGIQKEKSALMQQLLTGKRRVKLDSPEPALAKK